jgi:hypothetical protein
MPVQLYANEQIIIQSNGGLKHKWTSEEGENLIEELNGKWTLTTRRLIFEYKTGGLLSSSRKEHFYHWSPSNEPICIMDVKGLVVKTLVIKFLGTREEREEDYELRVPSPKEWMEQILKVWGLSGSTT